MKVNRKKSGILYLRKNQRSISSIDKFNTRDEHIEGYPVVREYKYLGIVFDEALNFGG